MILHFPGYAVSMATTLLGYLDYNEFELPEIFYLECFKIWHFRKKIQNYQIQQKKTEQKEF